MTGFSADWLSLREPADAAARDTTLTARLGALTRERATSRFIDLGCGTGANLRYLAPRIGGRQEWLLVDRDESLLARVGQMPGCTIHTRCVDLTSGLESFVLDGDFVVTASALLDLVSDRWLTHLISRCHESRAAALFALSYDGRITCEPADADDEWIRQLVNLHQRGDKGFGPALGPKAAERACELFSGFGYVVHNAQSDWRLQPRDSELQRALIEGWVTAAAELASGESDRCLAWRERRLTHVARGASRITVGHVDVLALPG